MTRAGRARSRGGAPRTLVAFEVGGVGYALDIQRVREIVRPLSLTPLPHVPDELVGVVDHRGDVVPIVDLRRRFRVKAEGAERHVRWVVVTHGARLLGLVVDRVTAVLAADDAAEREPPPIAAGQAERGIKGACSHQGRLLFVLDIDRVASMIDAVALPASAEALRQEVDDAR